jgi:hypothetical protein
MNEEKILHKNDAEKYIGEHVVIPEGYTEVANSAFARVRSKDRIKTMHLPDSLKEIGAAAFYKATNLKTVNVPKNLVCIKSVAFRQCESLAEFRVDANNPVYCDIDGVLYNKEKTKLLLYPSGKKEEVFMVPDSVISVSKYAFTSCENLTKVILPEGIRSIGKGAFSCCINLESINLPDSITEIKNSAFSNCIKLTHISVPNKITVLEGFVLGGCSGLVKINLPDSLLSIKFGAITGCTELTAITIPAGVTEINSWQFHDCHKLEKFTVAACNTSFTDCDGVLYSKDKKALVRCPPAFKEKSFCVPEGVEIIKYKAFFECELESIHLPKSVKIIETNAVTFYLEK